MSRRIFFSVGEPSGDLHAAKLIRELKRNDPTLMIQGFGGSKMVEAGFQQDYDLTQLAVMGFLEVLPKLREFFRLKDQAKLAFRQESFDACVLVDMPGFNWHIAAEAKKAGIPVFYYMPPQLWAWGQWRIRKMKRSVDHVLCALPMEQRYFAQHAMDATLVGHPFFEHVNEHPIDQAYAEPYRALNPNRLAVLPGSRRRELQAIWPLQLKILEELHRQFPQYAFDVACLNASHAAYCQSMYAQQKRSDLPIHFHIGRTSEVIDLSTCVLTKSGSVSLELLARRKPACVMYHATQTTYALGRMLSRVKFITLPNIIANDLIVPEYIAVGSSQKIVPSILESTSRLMDSELERRKQVARLDSVRMLCGNSPASTNAARVIFDRLRWNSSATLAAA